MPRSRREGESWETYADLLLHWICGCNAVIVGLRAEYRDEFASRAAPTGAGTPGLDDTLERLERDLEQHYRNDAWLPRSQESAHYARTVRHARDELTALRLRAEWAEQSAHARWQQCDALTARLAASEAAREAVEREPLRLIAAERERQVAGEGWTPEHDDAHADGSLGFAAA